MTLTLAGRYVVACLTLTVLLTVVGVIERVAWDAEKVAAVGIAVPPIGLIAAMAWRWEA